VLDVRWSRRSKPGRNNLETGRSSFAPMSSAPNHILFTRRLVTSARRHSTFTPGRQAKTPAP